MIMLQDEANDHDSAEDEVDDPDVEGGDAKEEEGDVDVEEEESHHVEEGHRSQDQEKHLVRACARNMRTDISQKECCMEIEKQNGCGHLRGHPFVRACTFEVQKKT